MAQQSLRSDRPCLIRSARWGGEEGRCSRGLTSNTEWRRMRKERRRSETERLGGGGGDRGMVERCQEVKEGTKTSR